MWGRVKHRFSLYRLRREHWIVVLAGALALPCASFARYQAQQVSELSMTTRPYRPGPTFQATADLVEIDAVVRRSNGDVADNLTARDFAIRDNGKPQTITQFSIVRREPAPAVAQVPPQPSRGPFPAAAHTRASAATLAAARTSIGFFLDDANTTVADLIHARDGVLSFVGSGLPSGEQVAVATGSSYGSIGFTRNAGDLEAALKSVAAHPLVAGGCPPLTGFEAMRIVNRSDYDLLTAKADEAAQMDCGCPPGLAGPDSTKACIPRVREEAQIVFQLAKQQTQRTLDAFATLLTDLAQRPGKRVVVFASDGFLLDFDLRPEMDKLITGALRAGIVVNALDAKGVAPESSYDVSSPDNGQGGRFGGGIAIKEEMMEQFQNGAGLSDLAYSTGGQFFQGSNDLRRGIRELTAPPKVAYELGFVPNDLKPDGSTHKLKISVVGHYRVQAPHGYTAPDRVSSAEAALTETLRREAASHDLQRGVVFSEGIGRYPQGTSRLTLTFDPHTLPLVHADGRNRDRLEIITAVYDRQGRFVTGEDTTVAINLRDATLRRVVRPQDDIVVGVRVAAPPGNYLLRVAAVESQKGRVGADWRPLVLTP
ncbi:MAG: VWA domain-containing protein [Terriglobales bacterium]